MLSGKGCRMPIHKGGCHCATVRYQVETVLDRVILCNCSICRKKGAVFHKVPESRFTLLQGADSLTLYRFNTRVGRHLFCRTCGIYCHHHAASTPDMVAVNVNTLDDDVDLGAVEVVRFDGRAWRSEDLHLIGVTGP